jgi:hypothetical protein
MQVLRFGHDGDGNGHVVCLCPGRRTLHLDERS